jgi:hypothetical protein
MDTTERPIKTSRYLRCAHRVVVVNSLPFGALATLREILQNNRSPTFSCRIQPQHVITRVGRHFDRDRAHCRVVGPPPLERRAVLVANL